MGNPIGGIAKRLLRWLVKHGKEELEQEIDKRLEDRDVIPAPKPPTRPPFPR